MTEYLEAWRNEIGGFCRDSRSLLFGVFDSRGELIDANLGMREFLDVGLEKGGPADGLVNPSFARILEFAEASGPVFEGQFTVGNLFDVHRTARARIYRKRDHVVIIGELEVGDLLQQTADLSALHQEASHLSREIQKEKKLLEATLEERAQTEERLRHAQKIESLGNLAGGIAHHINNILNPIMMLSGRLAKKHAGRKDLCEPLEAIFASSKTAAAIVRQMVTFSQAHRPSFSPIKIGDVISDALELAVSSAPDDMICELDIDRRTGTVLGDDEQIKILVLNLVSNALDAIGEGGGKVEIELVPVAIEGDSAADLSPGRYARLTVRDTGCGIEPENLSRLFDPFFTTKEVGRGTGLGLSVAHGIVGQHRGAIRVDSKVKAGTTVEIFLPLVSDPKDGP
ncbi:MAG: ATP-binding protein [Rhodospirillales bacterium]|nr:ATP-binding protein [Rhodospirillales bacterium]